MARGLTHFSPTELRSHRTNAYAMPHRSSMTAEQLAHAVGATKAQVLAYENGHTVPDPVRVRALAQALQIPPWMLMDRDALQDWALADHRRAAGLRAQDVVERLGISPKNYRRFENEGIVPSRRPQFVDEVASALGIPRESVERAIDRTPAVRRRQARAFDLVVAMADRYVPSPGAWRGPDPDDKDLIELAASYGRPVQRIRRVLTHELGELRQSHVRAQRERVIADYDTDLARQASARYAYERWQEIFDRDLRRIPRRLERFHRTAQPSDVWQTLVDLYNVDAVTTRRDVGNWAVTNMLSKTPETLPPHLITHGYVDDVRVCRLSAEGTNHVHSFAGLYAALFPGIRRPTRSTNRGSSKARSTTGVETFTLPNRAERLAVPQPFLGLNRTAAAERKTTVAVALSSTYVLTVSAASLSAGFLDTLLPADDMDW
ncbi:helix-turn-helix transcriptional regulator [Streptomyces sp. NPDC048188]|uniref:helix-turn-helix transcriptional regulator n=1 Tax=Streptomyces sp. NPDC048188 TaxID=3155749 RepID=UPI003421A715